MKISYETHYKSKREDGRHTSTMAAFMDRLRKTERLLKYPECAAAGRRHAYIALQQAYRVISAGCQSAL